MSLPLLTAVTPRFEADLVTRLGTSREVHVVRRCADLAELLGAAAAGVGRVAVVSAELRGLDRASIRELHEHGVLVLGLHRPGDEPAERTLRRWEVAVVLPADADQPTLNAGLSELIALRPGQAGPASGPRARRSGGTGPDTVQGPDSSGDGSANEVDDLPPGRGSSQPGEALPGQAGVTAGQASPAAGAGQHEPTSRGQGSSAGQGSGASAPTGPAGLAGAGGSSGPDGALIVVWGPVGAPGRSTVALNLAAELAEPHEPVLLVDLDTYGASIAQLLAVLDEAPGVAAAARLSDQGALDTAALRRLAPETAPGLRVLTGMPRPDRWPELREHAVSDVLDVATRTVAQTVVDVAFCLEADEELSFDTAAPRRNGATLAALEAADHVVAVGAADPVSLQRLVRGLDQLAEVTTAPVTVVVNRLRAGAVGTDPGRRVREALDRFAGLRDLILVAEDQGGVDAAVLAGQTLREARAGSPARTGLRELASRVGGRELAPPRGRRRARGGARV